MIMTTHKISESLKEYYFLVEYFDDGINISYWQWNDETKAFEKNKHHEILIDPDNAKELFSIALQQIETEYN